ncbi:MAG: DUF2938 domain-containing protein [Silicimonas sp.]|nr:DUF2938 domain-containing protein [Silicimonas sp.]
MSLLLTGILMGIGGTAAMDIWAWILERVGVAPFPNWAMPGRWFGHVFRGQVFHDDIGTVEPVSGELGLGWLLHYGVGAIYGVFFLGLVGAEWTLSPSFLPVWIFSLITIAAGWFLLQPGMGLGWAAAKTPSPWKVRGLGLLAHTVFALGMWSVALVG